MKGPVWFPFFVDSCVFCGHDSLIAALQMSRKGKEMQSIMPKPEDERKMEKAKLRSLRRWEGLDPSTRHPSPEKQRRIEAMLREEMEEKDE